MRLKHKFKRKRASLRYIAFVFVSKFVSHEHNFTDACLLGFSKNVSCKKKYKKLTSDTKFTVGHFLQTFALGRNSVIDFDASIIVCKFLEAQLVKSYIISHTPC